MPEPFLLIGLIAGIRRVLLLTTELAHVHEKPEAVFQHFIVELLVLTILIIALVISLVLLQAERNGSDRTCKMNPGSSSRSVISAHRRSVATQGALGSRPDRRT